MSQFRDQPFNIRFGAMGDEAEGEFESRHDGKYVRYGLNRPPIGMSKLPPFIRYTPDYLTSNGLVEVQGVGRDRMLKLKIEKALALNEWNKNFPLTFFIWDSKRQECLYSPWEGLWSILPLMPIELFPEGKPYWAVDIDEHLW